MHWIFPSTYSLFVRITVRQDRFPQFKKTATRVAAAFHQHKFARPWAAYSTVVGPGMHAYIMLPMEELGEVDGIGPVDQVMHDIYGEEGLKELEELRLSILDMQTSLLNRLDLNQVDCGPRPPQHLFYVSFKLHQEGVRPFLSAASEVFNTSDSDPFPWFAYATFAGEHRIHGFASSETIAGLENITTFERLIAGRYTPAEAERLMGDLNRSIVDSESSILRYLGHYNS